MSQSLRIKEDSYVNMFMEKEKVLKESKGNLHKIKTLEERLLASLTMHNDKVTKLETDNSFLRDKLKGIRRETKEGNRF